MHQNVPAAAANIGTILQYFPSNATGYTQSCDSFVIQNIKDSFQGFQDEYKLSLIRVKKSKLFIKLSNPGATFFLRLAVDSFKDLNKHRDEEGFTYACKAMIMCWLTLNKICLGRTQIKVCATKQKHLNEFGIPYNKDSV